jgi:Common central domain of tyrosinase/Putative peptidoglycan binding domain
MALTSPRFAGNARLQAAATNSPPMKKNEADKEATQILQQALKDLKYKMPITFAKGGPDGIYGDETVRTVRQFQIDQKFPPKGWDGRAGQDTLGRLDQLFAAPTPPPTPPTPPAPVPPGPQTAVTLRKNVFKMTVTEQQRYIKVITDLNTNGTYGTLVNMHRNMVHNMHAMNGAMPQGRMKFLPWHRVFLRKLEQEMQKLDAAAFVPFWHWQNSDPEPYPLWLDAFVGMDVNLPAAPPLAARTIKVTRNHGTKQELLRLAQGVGNILAATTFLEFTTVLEDEPHNNIHDWFGSPPPNGPGSTMGNVTVSPADPIFWTHHGEVDRIWALWQASTQGKGKNPDFTVPPPGQPAKPAGHGNFFNLPGDEVMQPLPPPNREDQFRDISALFYAYDIP